MAKMITALALCGALATAGCVDKPTGIPPNRVDQSSYVGAPGNGAP